MVAVVVGFVILDIIDDFGRMWLMWPKLQSQYRRCDKNKFNIAATICGREPFTKTLCTYMDGEKRD